MRNTLLDIVLTAGAALSVLAGLSLGSLTYWALAIVLLLARISAQLSEINDKN